MSKTRLTYFASCLGMALAMNWTSGCSAPVSNDPQGTGGSSGVGFLKQALELTFFPELWDVRTHLAAPKPR